MDTARPKIVPEETKMVAITTVPPRAGNTEEEGHGKEARAGTAQPAAGSYSQGSEGTFCFQTLVLWEKCLLLTARAGKDWG